MPTTTSFYVPVLMPDATPDGYTVGDCVEFTTLVAGGGGTPTVPTTGQIWPRGTG